MIINIECGWRDSNSHDLSHWYLKPARIPIPPRPLFAQLPKQRKRREHIQITPTVNYSRNRITNHFKMRF